MSGGARRGVVSLWVPKMYPGLQMRRGKGSKGPHEEDGLCGIVGRAAGGVWEQQWR